MIFLSLVTFSYVKTHFVANSLPTLFYLICIKQSFLPIMKAFSAQWSLLSTVQIPHPATENCNLRTWGQQRASSCVLFGQGLKNQSTLLKKFLFFRQAKRFCNTSFLPGNSWLMFQGPTPSLDTAYICCFVMVFPLSITTSGTFVLSGHRGIWIDDFTLKLQATIFSFNCIFLKTGESIALQLQM